MCVCACVCVCDCVMCSLSFGLSNDRSPIVCTCTCSWLKVSSVSNCTYMYEFRTAAHTSFKQLHIITKNGLYAEYASAKYDQYAYHKCTHTAIQLSLKDSQPPPPSLYPSFTASSTSSPAPKPQPRKSEVS